MTAMTRPSWAVVAGPLAPYAEGFRGELERLGYTPLTAATHMRLMAHLSRWLAREGMAAAGLTPAVVDAYFAERRVGGLCRARHRPGAAAAAGIPAAAGGGFACRGTGGATIEERLLARYRDYLLPSAGWPRRRSS